jgi:hypothetical protein
MFKMHLFLRYLLLLLLPLVVLAIPSPEANPAPAPAPQGLNLDPLLEGLGSIGDLLKPETFTRLEIILRNAAALLSDSNTKILVGVVQSAGGLLTKEFVDQIKGLIGDAAPVSVRRTWEMNTMTANSFVRNSSSELCLKSLRLCSHHY